MLNHLFIQFGLEAWKPVLTALALPPVPLLVLVLVGAQLVLRRHLAGPVLVLLSVALLWLSTCTGVAQLLSSALLHPPAAMSPARINALRAHASPGTAIVVLGGGVEGFAPEYGASSLAHGSLERLRYGIWLSRQTGLPMAFSGGVGWSQRTDETEARVAARIAGEEFKRPLRWVEDGSRDTHENAINTVALLQRAGVNQIILVTHAAHMPRALRAFEAAAANATETAGALRIEAAPLGLARSTELKVLDWMPSANGAVEVRQILREVAGRLAGA